MRLGGGKYEQLVIMSTAIEDHRVAGEPKIVIVLAAPDDTDQTVYDTLYTSNDAWDKFTKKRLLSYGFDPDKTPLFDLNGDDSPLKGKLVGPVTVEEDSYTKKDGSAGVASKVKWVGEFIKERMAPDAAKSLETALAARLGIKKQGAVRSTPKPAAVTPSQDKAAGAEDDDIPF